MYRSIATLAKRAAGRPRRTIVRDPRKRKSMPAVVPQDNNKSLPSNKQPPPLPFEPSQQNQTSVGSSMASYMLAGAGVAMGFTLVGAIFGGF